jgi:hypothetical protein
MARLLFTARPLFGSRAIRAVTWSDWSHVQAFKDDETLIGADWALRREDRCVKEQPFAERLALASKAAVMHVPVPYESTALQFLVDQLGKPYDTPGMLGLGLHRDWQEDDAWWCSELAGAYIEAGGRQLFRAGTMRRVDPEDLWRLPFPVEVLK